MPSPFAQDIEFSRLVEGEADADLIALLLEFGRDVELDLDPGPVWAEVARLGQLAREAVVACGPRADARRRLAAVSQILYRQEGFHGDEDDYYNPRHSLLHEVIRRQCGLPIILGIVYMAVARQAGLTMYGVTTPGHFFIAHRGRSSVWYVDPFVEGDVLTLDQCRERLRARVGNEAPLDESSFRPAAARYIAVRVLRNLKLAYARADGWNALISVQRRLALLCPEKADETRDLGLILLRNGQASEALPHLEGYLGRCDAAEAEVLRPYLRSARRMLAELN
jgi:regulator of sirC expression with transglutaminase-like and TPR domain